MQKIFNIGLLGCGNIGEAVAIELLNGKIPSLKLKKAFVKDLNKKRNIPISFLTNKADEILNDPEIDLIIEVLGGEEPALGLVIKALQNKKHLVTANKELIAKHGPQIFETAFQNNVQVRLDATVGGGIPIINTILDSLKANEITEVVGILNGTTNYILTQMKRGHSFELALKEAQEKGYAEPDPTNDLEGIDAKYKISILASLAFGNYISPSEVFCQGIKDISVLDFNLAKELGFSIKLLGVAKKFSQEQVEVKVYPCLIPSKKPLARIDDVLNAILVRGDLIQELLLVGSGAGAKPTSSAILGDVLSIQKLANSTQSCMPYQVSSLIKPNEGFEHNYRFYVRLIVDDQVGVIRDLGNILAKNNISLESISQKAYNDENIEHNNQTEEATLTFLTHEVSENDFELALKEVKTLKPIREIACILRVFE